MYQNAKLGFLDNDLVQLRQPAKKYSSKNVIRSHHAAFLIKVDEQKLYGLYPEKIVWGKNLPSSQYEHFEMFLSVFALTCRLLIAHRCHKNSRKIYCQRY